VPLSAQSNLGNGAVFLISSYGVYEVIAAACSSPQTTELNADKRAPTLMKWVHIGMAQAAVLVAIAAIIDPAHRRPIIAGAVVAAAFMEGSYLYAKKSGLESNGPPTESW
jgi:hypothetical protein